MKREKIFQSVRLGTSILVSALTGCASLHGRDCSAGGGLWGTERCFGTI